ncbi:hypothetical protein [Yoonia sp. SS1-5]|uniref:Uncharacterized protein n=1 Tax=Yoonia rhodophyticola TaxID=3137370 RepID=A0AAN0M8Z3_9RHOB
MLARLFKGLHLSRGHKYLALAFAAVIAVASGITLVLMTAIEGENAIPAVSTGNDLWIIVAGGVASGVALFLTRNWMGGAGALGIARAGLAGVLIALVAALIAGTLVSPVYGTLVGPFVLVAEFVAKPWLGVGWFAIIYIAHSLMMMWRAEQQSGPVTYDPRAVSQLSQLSQANLYRR